MQSKIPAPLLADGILLLQFIEAQRDATGPCFLNSASSWSERVQAHFKTREIALGSFYAPRRSPNRCAGVKRISFYLT
jgi:hypothetical protein